MFVDATSRLLLPHGEIAPPPLHRAETGFPIPDLFEVSVSPRGSFNVRRQMRILNFQSPARSGPEFCY